jgi:hypothetical protein
MDSKNLYAKVLAGSGLTSLLGPGTVRRSLADVGADVATATPADYLRSLPKLEARLRAYLGPEEAVIHIKSLKTMLQAEMAAAKPGA